MSDLAEDNSCVKSVKQELEIALMPKYIGGEERAVDKLLHSWRFKYNQDLKGILLSYSHVQFVSDFGRIIDDQPFIYWTITAEFQVFDVSVGQLVRGKIKQFGLQYVVCSVADCIDATIILNDEISDELSPYVKMDKQIIFQVNHFDASNCFIEGTITDECVKKMKQLIDVNSDLDGMSD